MRRFFFLLCALLPATAVAMPSATPDPYSLFERARQVWVSQRYPQYLAYVIAVTVVENGVQKTNHYSATYDSAIDRTYVDAISDEERLNPHVPTGTNMTVEPKRQWMTLFRRHVGHPEEAVDFLGVPMLAPNYSFGIAPYVPENASSDPDRAALVQEVRRQFNDPIASQRAGEIGKIGGLKEIGHVVSTNRDYRIGYDGVEALAGRACYHLSLRPLHAAARLRLREMWIDAQTFATARIVTAGNFVDNPVPWTITFAQVGGVQYIASEYATQPIGVGRHRYEAASISFQGIAPAIQSRFPWNPVTLEKNVLTEPPSVPNR